ncbi:ras association domain-containing protein 7 [Ornithorhynchus anatinus]|uniref:ras association domain-containing protein 7 n=1 Tax=Ornithorhynchus anatinus TaxID=9258 RepID=UPI0019D449A7|nr:ras association domain-containing protein 7 [Ornithorhynchus anatinus]
MELKVWVDGVQRVVCGVSDKTSCQEVVIALARAIGQTGRYVLIQRLREKERQLLPHECPVATQAQCGQSAHDVQFVLRRTGPSLAERPASDGCPPPPPPERNFARASLPAKARPAPGKAPTLGPGAERLREPGVRPDAPSPAPAPGREPPEAAELLRLERLVRRNEAELGEEAFWQGELRQERARQRQGQETVRGLRAATRDYVRQLRDLAARARALEEELRRARAPRPPAPRPRPPAPMRRDLEVKAQQSSQLQSNLADVGRALEAAERSLQAQTRELEDLNKELRQCNLQQFIQQTGATVTPPACPPPGPAPSPRGNSAVSARQSAWR